MQPANVFQKHIKRDMKILHVGIRNNLPAFTPITFIIVEIIIPPINTFSRMLAFNEVYEDCCYLQSAAG